MRERELRLALVCYGGISLAVYMHGVTKEIWHLARASRGFLEGVTPPSGSAGAYRALLEGMEATGSVRVRVVTDIIAGASAGGINGIFLAQAVSTGQSLEPLTDLWLDYADVDRLIDPDARPWSRFTKFWAVPIAWGLMKRQGNIVDATVEAGAADEVRTKLSRFVRARWFAPPFGGRIFSGFLFDAFDTMAQSPAERPLVPPGQPVDLIVTVTDLVGHPRRIALNSPPEVSETEHRLSWSFRAERPGSPGATAGEGLGHVAGLVAAARATASFPGAFPPFTMAELDAVLERRGIDWDGREAFITANIPAPAPGVDLSRRTMIDGSVLANAPFRPAIAALRQRPARREVDRRFVYIDPKPDFRSISLASQRDHDDDGHGDAPGFFSTILGALSEIPRVQPIRDNVEAIAGMSQRIRRMRRIVDAMRVEVEEQVETLFGRTFFLTSPTPSRLAAWRRKANAEATRRAGFAFASYGHLKLSTIVEDMANQIARLHGIENEPEVQQLRQRVWTVARARGIDRMTNGPGGAVDGGAVAFFRAHDLAYRIRRLRFIARHLDAEIEARGVHGAPNAAAMHAAIFKALGDYLDRQSDRHYRDALIQSLPLDDMGAVIDRMAVVADLAATDLATDRLLATALAGLDKADRRSMLFAWLGFAFYDLATLPLLQGEGHDEYDPIKIDRISPSDATAIRSGGARAVLKGIQFNAFGAFFSRAYRENDYLWGRLHGADRLIDIVASTITGEGAPSPAACAAWKRQAFHAILDEEAARLPRIADLIAALRREIG